VNSRERVLTALDHRQPDRCPTYLWINDDAMMGLVAYLGVSTVSEAEEILRIDKWHEVDAVVCPPDDYSDRIAALAPSEYREAPGFHTAGNGRVVRMHEGAAYLEDVVWHPLGSAQSPSDLESYPFPDVEWIHDDAGLTRDIAQRKKAGHVVYGLVDQAFKQAWYLRGMHKVLMDFYINVDLINDLYDRLYAYMTDYCSSLVRSGVDMIQLIGDLGMQNKLMISPAIWRKYDKWRLAKMIAKLKGINPALKMYMHTDGDVREIIEDLIQVGIDVLNPIQPECMDPVEIKKKYGDRLTLHGAVSLQRTLPFCSPEEVRQEVRYLIEHCNVNGGFVLGPSNVMFKELPAENIVAMYDAVY